MLFIALIVLVLSIASTSFGITDVRDKTASIKPSLKIINGNGANIEDFPFLVSILMISASGKSYSCGGSLLSKDVVLTAAHCLYEEEIHAPYSAEKIYVSAGSKERLAFNKNRRKAKSIHLHPDYKGEIFNNIHDIGIIMLSSPFNDRISRPIHISKRDVEKQTKLIALGWGLNDPDNLKGPTSFLQVELADDDSKICKDRIPKWVSDAQICLIVKENKDTCKGDSGGPLIYRHGNVNTLIGITSYGKRTEENAPLCGSNGGMSVFVHSYNYLKWISDITKISEEDLLTAQYDPSDAPSSTVSASLIAVNFIFVLINIFFLC